MRQAAYVYYKISTLSPLFDYFNPNKAADFKQNNYIAGLQYWFYPRCRVQAQYTFCDKKGDGQKGILIWYKHRCKSDSNFLASFCSITYK